MFRGRKRRLPASFVPHRYHHEPNSDEEHPHGHEGTQQSPPQQPHEHPHQVQHGGHISEVEAGMDGERGQIAQEAKAGMDGERGHIAQEAEAVMDGERGQITDVEDDDDLIIYVPEAEQLHQEGLSRDVEEEVDEAERAERAEQADQLEREEANQVQMEEGEAEREEGNMSDYIVIDSDDGENGETEEDYMTILEQMCEEWLSTELEHTVSKSAANAF